MSRVVHLRKEHYDVCIDRRSVFGNLFTVKQYGREGCIKKYREYFYKRIDDDPGFKEVVLELKGKILGCWCKPKACHGDIIIEYLNNNS